MFEAYKSKRFVSRKSVTSLVDFISGLWAHYAVGLARHKVEAALENVVLGHALELHAFWSAEVSPARIIFGKTLKKQSNVDRKVFWRQRSMFRWSVSSDQSAKQ